MYFVHRNGTIDLIEEEDQIEELRNSRDKYDLWVDLGAREVSAILTELYLSNSAINRYFYLSC